ncbi:Hypothetical protein, putative [Bodo saltans]|uniref:YEATS domain-containing protein n=1 Tax=Bodo saltans TaxID=75058 RepID=A0A0S4IUM8_BODSA|nr:Hypothetical protein, putative [Bodo saltans]|eukprot:CUF94459.1 Hypothetical protein, putative [Bodo saltans]
MPPSDASIIPFQRLRASFCIGSIAEPITAYDHHSTPGTTTAATDVDEIEPVVTSVTSSSLHADVSKSSTGRSNHLPDVIVVAAPNVASSHKRGVSRHTHRWSCYLRPVDDGAESLLFYSLIQSVTFKLDRSFNEPIRVIDAPPFAVSDVAWAEHHVEILVTFVEESGLGSFVSSSSSSGAGAAGNTSSSSGSGPTGSSTSGVTGASHHAHSQLLLHHTVFLRERVAPEFCHVGLTAARMIANGEPAKCLVVPDSLTQGSGGGGGGVGVGGSTSTAPSSHSEDQANGSVNRDQEENNHFSNVSIAARALREQLFTSHEGQTAAASSFDDKRRVSSALAMCMFSGGNAAAGGRVAVSERFDSLLVTHPRRKTVLFFQQLMRECKELEDEALAAASTSASTSSPSVPLQLLHPPLIENDSRSCCR